MLYNFFMEEKYINFYKKFILQTKTLCDSRVVLNRYSAHPFPLFWRANKKPISKYGKIKP